ncbi:hypothetical protein PUN28_005812 [Cardiocondyla obscurior]|uniref:Uncharacterized protein n=1 Tax=Cardiocondyla obscurior TaxID=286306 RepID=A0AAW2G9C2_9HYME
MRYFVRISTTPCRYGTPCLTTLRSTHRKITVKSDTRNCENYRVNKKKTFFYFNALLTEKNISYVYPQRRCKLNTTQFQRFYIYVKIFFRFRNCFI